VVDHLPEQITLKFDGPLISIGSPNRVTVTDPMGMQIAADPTSPLPDEVSAVLSPSMIMTGVYSVKYRVVSSDGHPQEGGFQFALGKQASTGASVAIPTSGVTSLTVHATGNGIQNGQGDPTGDAKGTFMIDFTAKTICYTVTTHLSDVTGIHIHARNTDNLTVSDEISIPVALDSINAVKPVCGRPSAEDLAKFAAAPQRFALVVHTKRYPEGAALGVFQKTSDTAAIPTTPSPASTASGGWILATMIAVCAVAVLWLFLTKGRRSNT
jgi:hypothetical protein